ncbi:serine dehydratase [Aureococcus anophagefferens]|nr:serine dehydratase [Aureococcus anophagefferens]
MMASRVARRSLHNLSSYRLPSTIEEKLCTPALIIYAEHVRWNIARVVAACGSPTRWQPHIKTVKSSWALDALCDAGVRHFKCATSREAELLGSTLAARDGAFEVLVAFPHTGPTLARLGRTAARYAANVAWSVLVEDAAGAEGAVDAGLGVYVDVNCGMDRTGTSLDGARRRARDLAHAGLRDSGRHRVSAGTVVLSDTRAEAQCPLGLRPAAVVASRVVSTPLPRRFTLDAGVKALAADAGHPMCAVLGHEGFEPLIPSEEHLPVAVREPSDRPTKGDVFYLVPKHVCPTVNLAESALVEEDGAFSELPIEARAHPLFLDEGPSSAPAPRLLPPSTRTEMRPPRSPRRGP